MVTIRERLRNPDEKLSREEGMMKSNDRWPGSLVSRKGADNLTLGRLYMAEWEV